MELILVRHGETKEGRKGILLGRMPGILTAEGRQFADRVGRTISEFSPHSALVVSSDLRRAKDTARIIARVTHVPLKYELLLRERSGGIAEGKSERQIDWKGYEQKSLAYRHHEGGESFIEVKKRAGAFLKKIEKEKRSPVVVVSHQALLAMLLSEFFSWSCARALKFDFRDKLVVINTKKTGVGKILLLHK